MSHPIPLPVPQFAEKLKLLLLYNCANQAGLAIDLNLGAANITRWKNEERVPALHARGLCARLGIPLELLLTSELEEFRRELATRFALGSGERWRRFAKRARVETALRLHRIQKTTGAREGPPRLGRLDYHPAESSALARVPRMSVGDKVRIALAGEEIAWAKNGMAAPAVVLIAEDAEGIGCLCPSEEAEAMVEENGHWWLPPPGRPGLYVNGPAGRHSIFALVVGVALPDDAAQAFKAKQLVWALDRTVEWLQGAEISHRVLRLEFIVV